MVYKTTNPLEAMEWVREKKVDLVFLDVQMPELSGMDFIRLIKSECRVILITAYPDYALEGYEHDVVDYLLKPVSFERFYQAALKAKELNTVAVTQPPKTEDNNPGYFFVKTAHKIRNIQYSSVLFVEAMQNYVTIHTPAEKIITLMSIKSMREKLVSPNFLRIHKSYIIAMDKIDTIEDNHVLIHEKAIPIGPTYREEFYRRIHIK